jgi:hypothetical protein
MPFLAESPAQHIGRHVGESQHCVALVKHAAGAPQTSLWRRGVPVQGGKHPSGVAIATFTPEGLYANATDGSSHACILLYEQEDGSLRVIDQWQGRVCAERVIRDRQGSGDACDDASRYFVVEVT